MLSVWWPASLIATERGTPARSRFLTAPRRRSWKSRPVASASPAVPSVGRTAAKASWTDGTACLILRGRLRNPKQRIEDRGGGATVFWLDDDRRFPHVAE